MKFRLRTPIPWYQIMRITFIQILISTMLTGMAYSNTLSAQNILDKKVTISLNNATLVDVLSHLQKNDKIKFIYSSTAIDGLQKVSINMENQTLKNVLDEVLKSKGINYEVLQDRIVLGKANTTANVTALPVATDAIAVPITGKVVDKNGEAIIGASILEKGTTNGVSTDLNGNFKLSVAGPASVLVVAYIGFNNQEVTVGSQPNLNITLTENVKNLNEVVVVGYGTQKKLTVTGAISSVKAADLQDQQVSRLDDALRGRVTGVSVVQSSGSPGSTPQIRVRGVTSRIASDPLYIIDGITVDNGGLDNVNPNDIESMEVLKDASAAIYGSRASNGVIIVTTKKGKKGDAVISYNGYVGFQSPVSKVKLANANQYATLRNQSIINDAAPGSNPTLPFPNPSIYGTGTNWQDEIFSNSALIQNHNLNISGATDKVTYYTSFGYLDQQGVVMPDISDYKKFNFTVNTTYKLKKWLTVGENFTYSYTRNKNFGNTNSVFGGPLSSALNIDPITPVLANNINALSNPGEYGKPNVVRNAQGVPYGISPYVVQEITNPLAYAQTRLGNYNDATNLLGSAFAEIEPIAGLKIRSQISAKQGYYGDDGFTPLYYLNASTSNTTTQQVQDYNRNLTWNWDNTATYTRSFGKHNFTALVGTSAQKTTASGLSGTFLGEPATSLNDASTLFALPAANRIAASALGLDAAQTHTLASTFGRLTYDYDQKYLFSGIIRRDGSSRFGSNHLYGTFPSAQVGYVISREDWFPKNSFVDFIKIRGSYGIVGNEMALGPFRYAAIVKSGRNAVFGDNLFIGYSPAAPANPDLKWESTQTSDIGFDATLFNSLTVTFDVYKKLTKDMLQDVKLPAYAGFTEQPSANTGTMENKGVELSLGYSNKIGQFNYNVSGNISYNKNTVLSTGNLINFIGIGNVQSTNLEIGRFTAGQPIGEFYGRRELGVFHSQAEIDAYTLNGQKIQPNAKPGDFKWQDANGDGKIDDNDRQFLGNPLPTFTYGINFNANYKEFDIKLFGQGVWGNKIYQAYRRLDIPSANYPIEALNAWTPQNPGSNYPRLSDADPNQNFKNVSNFNLQSGAYFRIKTLQLGYTLPKNILNSIDVKRVRVFVSSNNLVTITGYKGYDPEISGGIDQGIYPQARTFMAGLDITL